MVIRTVRMTLRPAGLKAFLDLFLAAQPRIQAFPGCCHLELWQDERFPNIITSYSHWTSAAALEEYRKSPFFKETWRAASALFAAPALAHSSTILLGEAEV